MHSKSRRYFIRNASLACLFLSVNRKVIWAAESGSSSFIFPIDGDILHSADGIVKSGLLNVNAIVNKSGKERIYLNDALVKNNKARVSLLVKPGINNLSLRNSSGKVLQQITFYYAPHLDKQYRISIDDAIWFLRDIHQHREQYSSIFQNPFLAYFKELHKKHNIKLHINLFYETDGFNLSEMTDKFKAEWIANADWLRLSIHAKSEFPDNPYKHAGYDDIKKDTLQINREIERFAGKELTGNETTLHWGEVPVEVSRGLRDAGYNIQVCDFNVDNDLPPCSYYLTVPERRHMNKRFVWRDNAENISFVRSAIIVDTVKREKIIPFLDDYATRELYLPYVDFLIHEQYFYSFYKNYQPDYTKKLDICVDWAIMNNYKPGFVSESLKW